MSRDNPFIVGLDIGTTKITTVIGELSPNGSVDIIGEGTVPSEGIKRGAVVNLERTTHAIRQSVAAAERVSGVRVSRAYVSVSGHHVHATTSHGLAAIRRNQEITLSDVERAIENARAIPQDPNYEVIHAIPQEYVVDGQDGIKSAVGMHGVRLEVDVHLVSAAMGPLANVRRCVQEAGLSPEGFVLQSLASGLAVLDAGERDQTVLVIDMGGGTTDVGVFRRGMLAYSACIPIGGDHVTSDLMQILKIPLEEAEKVKRSYGAAMPDLADPDLTLEITSATGQTNAITAYDLARIIRPRVAEIFDLIRAELESAMGPVEMVADSVVVTGGGTLLLGVLELARERLRLPVRIGRPRGINGLADIVSGPLHATAVGLVLYGAAYENEGFSIDLLERPQDAPVAPVAPAAVPSAQAVPVDQMQVIQPAAAPAPKPVTETAPDPTVIARAETKSAKPAKSVKEKAAPKPGEKPSLGTRLKDWFKDWM